MRENADSISYEKSFKLWSMDSLYLMLPTQESDVDLTSISASLDLGLMMHRKCVGCLHIVRQLKL